jgi:hypothetical protein
MNHIRRSIFVTHGICGLAGLLVCCGSACAAPAGVPGADATRVATLRQQVATEGSRGRLSEALFDRFLEYTEAAARQASDTPEEFWTWLRHHPRIRAGLLIALHPTYEARVIKQLNGLREAFGDTLDEYTDLGLAVALVYGLAPKGRPGRPPAVRGRKRRPAPTARESFQYYVTHADSMLLSPKSLPWRFLVYVVGNDIPLMEREWALKHLEDRSLRSLRKLHFEVPYRTKAQRQGSGQWQPGSLRGLLQSGGVCAHRAYYASRTLKSAGIPAVIVGAKGHAWQAWIVRKRRYKLRHNAEGPRPSGVYRCLLTGRPHAYETLELLVAATNHSPEGHLKALAGCAIFKTLPDEARQEGTGLLRDAIDANPYCETAWLLLGGAVAAGTLPAAEGQRLHAEAVKRLKGYDNLIFRLFLRLKSPQLKEPGAVTDDKLRELRAAFEVEEARARKHKRPDLVVRLHNAYAEYFVRARGVKPVLVHYTGWLLATRPWPRWWFNDLLEGALRLSEGTENTRAREAFLSDLLTKLGWDAAEPNSSASKGKPDPRGVPVARAYATLLAKTGRAEAAKVVHAMLQRAEATAEKAPKKKQRGQR